MTSSTATTAAYTGDVPVRSIDEVLADFPMSRFHHGLCVMCGLVFMADALEVSLLSFLGDCVAEDFGLADAQIAALTTSVFVGQLFGSMTWGPVADKYGRRNAYLAAGSTIAVASWASGFAPNYAWLVFLRTIVGIGIGGSTVPFDLVAEFLPPDVRGSNLMLLELFWTVGSMMVIGAAWLMLSDYGWRVLIYVTAAPMTVVLLVAFWLLPESPRWLLSKRRFDDAEAVIMDAARISNVVVAPFKFNDDSLHGIKADPISTSSTHSLENPLFTDSGDSYHSDDSSGITIEDQFGSTPGKFGGLGSAHSTFKSPSREVSSGGNPGMTTVATPGGGRAAKDRSMDMVPNESFLAACRRVFTMPFVEVRKSLGMILSTPEDKRTTGYLAVIWLSFGFTYYGLILLVTRLYKESDGDNGGGSSNATCSFDYADILVNSTGEIPGVIITYLIIDRVGRKITQTGSYLLGALCLVILGGMGHTSGKGAILALSLIARACAMASSCVTWVVTPELYKTEARATAHSFLNCIARFGAGASPFFVVSNLGTLSVAIVLGIINAVAAFAAYQLRETMGGSMDAPTT